MAAWVVGLFGACVAALGLAGAASPGRLLEWVTRGQTRLGLGGLAVLRIGIAIALWWAAPDARAPLYLRVLAGLALLSGIATPFFGRRRFEAVLAWWRARPDAFVRAWSLFVVLFGASLVWSVAAA